jgi:hypothetical protein
MFMPRQKLLSLIVNFFYSSFIFSILLIQYKNTKSNTHRQISKHHSNDSEKWVQNFYINVQLFVQPQVRRNYVQ